jgi:hypothetical protein
MGKMFDDLGNWTFWQMENQKTSFPTAFQVWEFALLPLRYVYGLIGVWACRGPGEEWTTEGCCSYEA